jgi:hypothetical protein
MNEFFLHYIWKYQLYNITDLRTTSGDTLRILKPGEHNSNAGPDFFNGRIQCNGVVIAGNIEVHFSSSDWKKHDHQKDKSYQNVILHVVYNDDAPVISASRERILTLELRHRIPKVMTERYEDLQQLQPFIPCQQHFASIDKFTRETWLQRLLIERLEEKCLVLQQLLDETYGNWEHAFYIALAKNFGFKINAVPFELTARSIPYHVISKSRNSLPRMEALLFGAAGYLQDNRIRHKYYKSLRDEFKFLQEKHGLQIIDVSLWKLLRLRPANFPQLRLAQFAALLYRNKNLLGDILEKKDAAGIKKIIRDAEASEFWHSHYTLQKNTSSLLRKVPSSPGEESVDNILINTLAPFIFLYGRNRMRHDLQDLAVELLEKLNPEQNQIIRKFEALGSGAKSSGESQALLQLKKHYCDLRRCLECGIGLKILKE